MLISLLVWAPHWDTLRLMASITLRAHYDGEHVVLDEPFDIPLAASLTVTLLAPVEFEIGLERERANWASLSARNLARAYGNAEPEYTVADVRPCD